MFIPVVFVLFLSVASLAVEQYEPEGVHLAFGDNINDIVVTWSTFDDPGESKVRYGVGELNMTIKGTRTKFVDGGNEKHHQYIHRVYLKNLAPGQKYEYHCGSRLGWSDLFFVRIPPASKTWAPQIVIFGDMGNENAQSLARLQEEAQRELYNAAIHVGDFAYDMDSENAHVGDEFMNQVQKIAAYLPYMTVPGNHEEKYNFSNYRARFSMPGNSESLWYSFNIGPVHFIGINTEVYYFLNYGLKQVVKQFTWLENDLIEATKPEVRAQRPWIVTFGHRPMYCSNNNSDDCTNHESLLRVGLPFFNMFGLEDLFYKYRVDLHLWAHEHSYERMWPMYNFKVYNGSYEHPYRNYGAPVHMVTGSAGCKEGREKFLPKRPAWSAYRSSDYGYTRMKVYNGTHMYLEQVSDDKAGATLDYAWLIKNSPEPQYSPS